MTRKDYRALAVVIKAARNMAADPESIDRMARGLVATLRVDNPRFDRARFLAACGVPTE